MQRFSASNDSTYGDRTLGVQALKSFQVSIVKWILVVPLKLERKAEFPKDLNVVNLV